MSAAILTKWLGPTNTRGARIKAWSCDYGAIYVRYAHALGSEANHDAAARAFAEKVNDGKSRWAGCYVRGYTGDGYCYVRVRPGFNEIAFEVKE